MYQSSLPLYVILGTKCLWNFYLLALNICTYILYVSVCMCIDIHIHVFYRQ